MSDNPTSPPDNPQKRQLALGFTNRPDFSLKNFLELPSNSGALQSLRNFPQKEGDILVIYGAKGVGKTHLLNIWAEQSGDRYFRADELQEVPFNIRKIAVDNLEKASAKEQETLFFLFNHIVSDRGAMLIASEKPVAQMELIPELQSRLLTAPQVEIQAPDEASLQILLIKWAADKQLQLEPKVVKYILNQCERSPVALQSILSKLDRLSLEQKRRITVPLVKEAL